MSSRSGSLPLTAPLAGLIALVAEPLAAMPRAGGPVQPPPPLEATTLTRPATVPVAVPPAANPPAGSGKASPSTAAITGTRQILLELGKRQISLLENGKPIRSWPVAIGDPGTPTPTGRFTVENKVVNPQYQSTKSGKINPTLGAQGPLGDRWIGFKKSGLNQYGIHGTPSAWAWTVTSRAAVSNGCVRMLTPHVRELFEKVEVGTPVVVTH
jgi:lipoprotein-anchoring transpeptidase ErfK/SrfK